VYVPAPRLAGETSTESVDGAVPDAGATDSQDAFVAALQVSGPPLLFVTWMNCVAGIVDPTTYANCRLKGATEIEEAGAATMLMESHADDDNST